MCHCDVTIDRIRSTLFTHVRWVFSLMCANFCVAVATRPRVITENVNGVGKKCLPHRLEGGREDHRLPG